MHSDETTTNAYDTLVCVDLDGVYAYSYYCDCGTGYDIHMLQTAPRRCKSLMFSDVDVVEGNTLTADGEGVGTISVRVHRYCSGPNSMEERRVRSYREKEAHFDGPELYGRTGKPVVDRSIRERSKPIRSRWDLENEDAPLRPEHDPFIKFDFHYMPRAFLYRKGVIPYEQEISVHASPAPQNLHELSATPEESQVSSRPLDMDLLREILATPAFEQWRDTIPTPPPVEDNQFAAMPDLRHIRATSSISAPDQVQSPIADSTDRAPPQVPTPGPIGDQCKTGQKRNAQTSMQEPPAKRARHVLSQPVAGSSLSATGHEIKPEQDDTKPTIGVSAGPRSLDALNRQLQKVQRQMATIQGQIAQATSAGAQFVEEDVIDLTLDD